MKNLHIVTNNLLIREITSVDVFALEKIRQEIATTPENRPYYALQKSGDAIRFCKDALAQQQETPRKTLGLAITEKSAPHKMIGFIVGELTPLDKNEWGGQIGLADMGYFLSPEHQGKGYVTEAMRGVTGRIFFEELGYEYVNATVHPENKPSLAVLQSVGMKVYGETKKYGNEPRLLLKVTKEDFFNHTNRNNENKNAATVENTKVIKALLPASCGR